MPRLPDVDTLGARPTPVSRRGVATVRNPDAIGAALAQAGGQLANDGLRALDRENEARDAMDVAKARSAFLTKKVETENALDADPDFDSHEPRYTEALTKAKNEAAGLIRNKRAKAFFELQVAPDIEQGVGVIRGRVKEKRRDASRAELITQEDTLIGTALGAKDEATATSAIQTYSDLLASKVGAGDITAQEAAAARAKFTERYGLGRIDRMSDQQQADILSKSLASDKPSGTVADFIPRDKRQNLLQSAQDRIEAEQRRQEAEARAAAAEVRARASEARQAIRDRLADFRWQLDAGVPVATDQINAAIGAARSIGAPELANGITALAIKNHTVQVARTMSPVELQTGLNALNAKIAAAGDRVRPGDLIQRDTLATTLATMKTGTATDPLSYAAQSGIARITPINVDAPDPRSFVARRAEAKNVAKHYRVAPKFFTDEERSAFKAKIDAAKPAEKVALARSMAAGFGPDAGRALLEISPDRVFAHAGGLARLGRVRTAERIFTGQTIAATNKGILPAADIQRAAVEKFGNALSFIPEGRSSTLAAANAIYATEAAKRGWGKDDFDEEVWGDALNEAVGGVKTTDGDWRGGVHKRRGVSVVLPANKTADDFDDAIDGLDDAKLARASVGSPPRDSKGRPINADAIKRGYLFDAGGGRYFVAADRQGRAFYGGAGPGGRYVIDANKL